MGHDIYGYDKHGEEVAYLRRSAGNPLGRVIYIALDSTEYDAGVSGCGESATFTKAELQSAMKFLLHEQQDFGELKDVPTLHQKILRVFSDMGCTVVAGNVNQSIQPELEFLNDCLKHCEQEGVDELMVFFG